MEAEINRILDLLAEGKINAAEAERLIVALRRPAPSSRRGGPDAERPIPEPLARLDREARAAGRRLGLWCHRVTLTVRCREQAHRRTRAALAVEERVRYILAEHLLVEPDTIATDGSLASLVTDQSGCTWGARLGWEVLRLAVEDEFVQYWTASELGAVSTVGGFIGEIERRAASGDAPVETPEAQPEAAPEPEPGESDEPPNGPAQ